MIASACITEESILPATFGIIDLFAGPGGLGEGFASLDDGDRSPFRIGLSVEKEPSAHRTLRLRAFLREHTSRTGRLPAEYIDFHAGRCAEPDWAAIDGEAWTRACAEARCLTLGTDETRSVVDRAIDRIRQEHEETVLIGGPPCQAYSLVGRARQKGIRGYRPEDDHRHFLFREYIRVLDRLQPAVFVMENVKGILSSSVQSRRIFEMLMEDLSSLGGDAEGRYVLHAIAADDGILTLEREPKPSDFIVRAEDHGVPQARHRVIIVGIRADIAGRAVHSRVDRSGRSRVTVDEVIASLPRLRSGLTPARADSDDAWRSTVLSASRALRKDLTKNGNERLVAHLQSVELVLGGKDLPGRTDRSLPPGYGRSNSELLSWIENEQLDALAQHESRGHMPGDLARYLFTSAFGRAENRSPKAADFPERLAPEHRSWTTGKFADRFRVQLATSPSTTITSHISKDGHYFIHPDPAQCRSLTVREAARLQTFPDDYLFLGNRTQQYVQVGNAVPPFLARQIAQLVLSVLKDPDSEAAETADVCMELAAG